MRPLALLPLAVALSTHALPSQTTTLDEGSFTISVNGSRAGREDFRIRRTADNAQIQATATVTYNDRRLAPRMNTNLEGEPTEYVVEVREGAGGGEVVSGLVGRGRVSARVKSSRGESAKEFIVSNGAIVIDDEVFHQYYFITKAATNGAVPVIVPRRNTQVTMRVTRMGTERVDVGGTAIEAQKFRIADPSGADRDVWADSAGRVLKVEIASRGIVAIRDEPPR